MTITQNNAVINTATDATLSAESVVAEVENFLALSDAVAQLSSLLSDPNATTAQIAEVISIDPSLSARVLRLVNSAYFSLNIPVDTISRSVSILGTGQLYSLVLASSAGQLLNNFAGERVDMEAFWKHSVRTALAAGSLAARGGARQRERVFLSGLLHDVGQIILACQLPELSARIQVAIAGGERRDNAERALLGYSHAELGAALLERWNLPASLTEPVRYQDRCREAPLYSAAAAMVHIGSAIVRQMESSDTTGICPAELNLDPAIWQMAGCHPDQPEQLQQELEQVMHVVDMHWFQVISLIAPNAMLVY